MFDKSISKLLVSPMFHLSLSSKELFHSNFISWLFLNYREECSKIMRTFIDDNEGSYSIKNVKREEKNRDLIIYFENELGFKKKLTIENKLKSLPNLKQLEEYSLDKTESDYFLLLSLTKPIFSEEDKFFVGEVYWKCYFTHKFAVWQCYAS
jgi:hypothetical protein